jgi:hypothetical protein
MPETTVRDPGLTSSAVLTSVYTDHGRNAACSREPRYRPGDDHIDGWGIGGDRYDWRDPFGPGDNGCRPPRADQIQVLTATWKVLRRG